MWTLPFLSPVSQVPSGSAACAGAGVISATAIAERRTAAAMRKVLIVFPVAFPEREAGRIAGETGIASWFPAGLGPHRGRPARRIT
jgi:hypothetical protein